MVRLFGLRRQSGGQVGLGKTKVIANKFALNWLRDSGGGGEEDIRVGPT